MARQAARDAQRRRKELFGGLDAAGSAARETGGEDEPKRPE